MEGWGAILLAGFAAAAVGSLIVGSILFRRDRRG